MTKLNRNMLLALAPVVIGGVIWMTAESDNSQKSVQAGNPTHTITNADDTNKQYGVFGSYEQKHDDSEERLSTNNQISETAPLTDDSDDLQKKLTKIEKELETLQIAMNEIMTQKSIVPNAENDPELQKQIAQMTDQQDQLEYEYIESTFASEAVDPGWSQEVTTKLNEGLAEIDGFSSPMATCGTTMCRVTATSSGDGDAMAAMHMLDSEIDWDGEMRITLNHQSGELTAYLARSGNQLPKVE